jgi:hypothetical protein
VPGRITKMSARFVTSYLLPTPRKFFVPTKSSHLPGAPKYCDPRISPPARSLYLPPTVFGLRLLETSTLLQQFCSQSFYSISRVRPSSNKSHSTKFSFRFFFVLVKEVCAFTSCSSCSSSFRETPYRLPLMFFSCQTFLK